MKTRQLGAELFHADRRTNRHMMTPTVDFRDFENAPKNFPFWTLNEKQSTGIKIEVIARIFFSVTSKIKGIGWSI